MEDWKQQESFIQAFQKPQKGVSEALSCCKIHLKCVYIYFNSWALMYVRVHLLSNGYEYLYMADSEIGCLTGLLWLIKFFLHFH